LKKEVIFNNRGIPLDFGKYFLFLENTLTKVKAVL